MEGESLPTNVHEAHVRVQSFFLDRAPVGSQRYARYLRESGYVPREETNFLREWPDWRTATFAPGNETVQRTPTLALTLTLTAAGSWLPRRGDGRPSVTYISILHLPNQAHLANPHTRGQVPVTGISLSEARDFCEWAGGRLPTSIEWQYV